MTGAEFLRRIYELEDSLACKEDEIRKIRSDIISLHSVDTSAAKVDGGKHMDTSDKVIRLMEVEAALNADWDALIKWREVARKMIGRMLTDQNRIVLMVRIVNHRSWKQVASILDKSEDYVRHLYPIAVAEFEARVAKEYPGYLENLDFPDGEITQNNRDSHNITG